MNNAQTLFSMPGVGFIGMLIIGILAGYIAEKGHRRFVCWGHARQCVER